MGLRVAVLDDYQNVARGLADWSSLPDGAELTVFNEYLGDSDAVGKALDPFDVVVAMRERTAFPASLLARLPRLRLLVTTGASNAAIDVAAARDRGVTVCGTGARPGATPELTWGLILALARHIPAEHTRMREGGWQHTVGTDLAGSTLGLVGLGRIGRAMARIGRAFDMEVLAWSQNLTAELADAAGARAVSKSELFAGADFVSIHYKLSERSTGLVAAPEFAAMKSTAFLVNTSRGPIVDEGALLTALRTGAIAGAGLDVFDTEPLPEAHPYRTAPNLVLTPHLGYVTERTYKTFYSDALEDILAFVAGTPLRVVGPA